MRIAQMLDTLHFGGAQQMQIFLVQSLRPLGIEVTVINLGSSTNQSILSQLEASGARVVNFPFDGMFRPVSFLKLVHFLRAEQFDLLHAYLTYSNTIGSFAGWLSGIPVIASVRNAGYNSKTVPMRRLLIENVAMKYFARRVTANGFSVGEFAKQRLGDKMIDIIVNSVDLNNDLASDERIDLRKQMTGSPDGIIVFSAGRLVHQKGFVDLIDAFHAIHSKYSGASLVIAGSGQLESELRSRVNELGLQERVFFLGFRNDVHRLMQAADIYVNSSYWEGTPVSVLEAMASGLPIIATAVGENPYLLDENCGILVPPKDPSQLSSALDRLLSSPEDRMALGAAARRKVEHSYSRETWRNTLLHIYAQVTPLAAPYLANTPKSERVMI